MLFVGQAPGRGWKRGDKPLHGSRLRALVGRDFASVNLLPRWPGKHGKGDAFDLKRARRAAARIERAHRGGLLVLAGHNVARAFRIRSSYFEIVPTRRGWLAVVIPHPSGINRWWNEPVNRRRAGQFFSRLRRHFSDDSQA